MSRATESSWKGLVFPLGILALWFLLGLMGKLNAQILPSPGEVFEAFLFLCREGLLWSHVGEGLIGGLTFSITTAQNRESSKVEAFMKAQNRSLMYMVENYDAVLQLAAAEMNLPLQIVTSVAEKYTFSTELTEGQIRELEETIEFLYSQGLIRKRISLEDLL